jgi:integrase
MTDVNKVAFTDRFLQTRKPSPTRIVIWDAVLPGLCVRVGRHPVFYIAKRPPGSPRTVWIRLGIYPMMSLGEARAKAREALGAILEGKPAPRLSGNVVTFAVAVERYITECLADKRVRVEKEQLIRRELIPVLGAMPLTAIRHEHLVDLLQSIGGRPERRNSGRYRSGGPHAARKALVEIAMIFRWASFHRLGGLSTNPASLISGRELTRGIVFNKIRDRVLTDAELRTVWQAAGEMGYPFGSLVRALILTGQRLSELADAQWCEIDEGLGCLAIPAERMKNKQVHTLPLTARMSELLAGLPRFEGGSFVFSSTWGRKPTVGHSNFKIRLDRIIATIAPVESWQLHDIRRTVRTGLARAGVPVFDAELIIAHQQSGVHGVYDRHRYQDEKRAGLLAWERLLEQILSPPDHPAANVVGFPTGLRA